MYKYNYNSTTHRTYPNLVLQVE